MGLGHIWVPILAVWSWANCLTSLSFHSVSFGVEYYSLLDLLCMAVARFESKSGYEDTLKAESTTQRAGLSGHFPSALWAGGGKVALEGLFLGGRFLPGQARRGGIEPQFMGKDLLFTSGIS